MEQDQQDSKNASVNGDVLYKSFEIFGRYQFIQFVIICIPLFVISMMHVNYVFVAEAINYRCFIPECEDENSTIDTPAWWPEDVDPKCQRPVSAGTNGSEAKCSNHSFSSIVEDCHEWIYENDNTIFSALNLACQPWKVTLIGSIHNAGMIVSMSFTGWIADKIGRQPTTIICSVGGAIGLIKLFVTEYYAYIAIEFLESVIASGLYTVAVVLMIEVGGPSKRVMTGIIFSYSIYVGEIIFSFIAMGFQYWKYMIIAVYSPMILFASYCFILGESTRWQILRGQMDKAKKTLILIAKLNKIDIDADTIKKLDDQELRSKLNIQLQTEKDSFGVILKSKEIMTRLFVASVCFFTSSFLYYGLIVHAVYLPGNKYINFILSSLTSFPGEVIAFFMFDRVGRRISLQFGYIVSAVFLVAQNFTPESISWLRVLLFCLGKMGVVICFTGIYTYSLELFPTSVRGSLLGIGNTVARIGSMLAPLTPLMSTDVPALPFILFASTAVVSAILLVFTPETKTLPLFDTVAQIKAYENKIVVGM